MQRSTRRYSRCHNSALAPGLLLTPEAPRNWGFRRFRLWPGPLIWQFFLWRFERLKMDHQELLKRVESLLKITEGAAFVVPADTGYFSIDDDLVKRVREAMVEAVDLLRELSDFYDQVGESEGEAAKGDDLLGIGAQISSELAAREIASLAFAGRGQIAESRDALAAAVKSRQIWVVASHADTGLRRIGKALIAVETAMREYEGLPALERHWVDLEVSFEIRRLYGQFRRAALRGKPEAIGEEQVREFKSIVRRISILRDLKIYPFMRIDDRLAIRQLQKRILAWLDQEVPDKEEGQRLWQDLVSFARLLGKVNEREELRQHDRRLVMQLDNQFQSPQVAAALTATQQAELQNLVGLDDELDEFLLRPDITPVDLKATIARLRQTLDPPRVPNVANAFRAPFGDG